jgi:hypothetical protein
MKKIGIITIGQSPRPDILPDMMMILGEGYEVIEAGALDDYSLEEIQKLDLGKGEHLLVTRMRDGTEVMVSEEFVEPIIQQRITEVEKEGVDVILLLCTGRFPEFEAKSLIVKPSEIMKGAVNAALRKGRLGIVLPGKKQIAGRPRERVEIGGAPFREEPRPNTAQLHGLWPQDEADSQREDREARDPGQRSRRQGSERVGVLEHNEVSEPGFPILFIPLKKFLLEERKKGVKHSRPGTRRFRG